MNHSTEPTPAFDPARKLSLRGGRGAPAANGEAGMEASDVGKLLCAARMRLGKDLQDIAALLHIRYTYLVAIEDGRYEDLPGQAYALGFVRAYAEHLGLDGDEVVRRFKDENAGLRRKASLDFPMPAPESGIPSGALLLVAVVAGMLVYGVWYSFAGADRNAAALIQEVPARLSALLKTDTAIETAAVSEAVAPTSSPIATSPEPQAEPALAPGPVVDAMPTASKPLAAAPAQPPEATAEAVPPIASEPARLADNQSPAARVPAEASPAPAMEQEAAPAPDRTPTVGSSGVADDSSVRANDGGAPSERPVAVAVAEPARAAPTAPLPVPVAVSPGASEAQAPPPSPAPVQSAAPPPAAPAAPAGPASASRLPASKDVIELRARSDSWIQVRSGDQLLLTRLLRKGETYRVPDRSDLTLMTGNAGGLEVLINGTVLPPLGNEGSVARGVPLDANRLMTMAKAAEPGEPVESGAD